MTANTTKKKTVEGEEKLLNNNFDQIYKGWWGVQRSLVKDYPTALNIFTWLIEIADKKNSIIVSYESIGKSLGLSRTTVYEAIKYLKENAFLTVLKTGNMNIYVLNDQIVWKDTADKKDKFSQFSAKVHIMASEQEEPYRTQLIGHAVPKVKTKRVKLSPEEAIKGFEAANPIKSPKSGLEGLKSALNRFFFSYLLSFFFKFLMSC
jgi:DNA-binding transcriptional ArsR family regulator